MAENGDPTLFLATLPFVSEYLTSELAAALCTTCSQVRTLLYENEGLWKQVLQDELGMNDIAAPPTHQHAVADDTVSYRLCFLAWKTAFQGNYSVAEVKLARVWWGRMEAWLGTNFPLLLLTLNPPPRPENFVSAEARLGYKIPRLLKLLYMFHDGQSLAFDQLVLGQARPEDTRFKVFQSIYLGLFGGYNFYDQNINMRFLPLSEMAAYTVQIPPDIKSIPQIPPVTDIQRWCARHHSSSEYLPWQHYAPNPRVCVFSCNAVIQGLEKIVASAEGSLDMADGLFANYG
jgi:hypothetical protein